VTTLRDVARQAVRDEVLTQAWTLFAAQGFEATTIDQVAEAAGMSRRTFFRYFAGKDELILARILEAGERVAATLEGRPADEPAWPALRAAFEIVIRPQEVNGEISRTLQHLLREEPGVRGINQERLWRWQQLLVPLVAVRMPDGPDAPLRASVVVGAALACLDAAQEAWLSAGPSSPRRLGDLLDTAMGVVSPRGG
jgi:AcrR family transcriptional regulator